MCSEEQPPDSTEKVKTGTEMPKNKQSPETESAPRIPIPQTDTSKDSHDVSSTPPAASTEADGDPKPFDFGGLPDRNLKKNLGCG